MNKTPLQFYLRGFVVISFFFWQGSYVTIETEFSNFKQAMVILILSLANYLLDIMSLSGPTLFRARGKILGFEVCRWLENAFPSLVRWTYQFAKAPHFLYYVPQNILSPASLKEPTPLPVQFSVTSGCTVLNSRFYRSFLFWMVTQGVMGHLLKT